MLHTLSHYLADNKGFATGSLQWVFLEVLLIWLKGNEGSQGTQEVYSMEMY